MFNTWHQIQGAIISQGLQLLLHVAFSTSKLPFLAFRVVLSSRRSWYRNIFAGAVIACILTSLTTHQQSAINPQRNTISVIGNPIEIVDCGIHWCPIGFIPE